ncbi:MAG: ester cyclase [Anaerolineae bacterium]|nr:ester cyclase [Anaerolineae bacterium]
MSSDELKSLALEILNRGFNQGDLSVIDAYVDPQGVDHQEPPGTLIIPHLKHVITMLHTAFPDLHFEVDDLMAQGDTVAFRATMTGTHQGPLHYGMPGGLPATGRKISVAHMYFIRFVDGKNTDLWHVWDVAGMLRQLGVTPPQRQPA